jgi:hypothetical protein
MELQIPGFKLPARVDITVGHRYGSMVTIHDRDKIYADESFEQVMEMVRCKDQETTEKKQQAVNNVGSNGFHSNKVIQLNGNCKSYTIRLHLLAPPTNEQAVALKALLVQYPGNNVVALDFISSKGPENVVIGKFPTCLNLADADKFGVVLPCKVLVEKAEEHFDYMATAMGQI